MDSQEIQRSKRSVNSLYKTSLVKSPSISFTAAPLTSPLPPTPVGFNTTQTPMRPSYNSVLNNNYFDNNTLSKILERLTNAEESINQNNVYIKKLEEKVKNLEEKNSSGTVSNHCNSHFDDRNQWVDPKKTFSQKTDVASKYFQLPIENRYDRLSVEIPVEQLVAEHTQTSTCSKKNQTNKSWEEKSLSRVNDSR